MNVASSSAPPCKTRRAVFRWRAAATTAALAALVLGGCVGPMDEPDDASSEESSAASSAAVTWKRWEASLTSSKSYANPYADVTVSVTYTGPSGQIIKADGFWDGGNTFRFRFMFPKAGTWSWKTTCSDTTNAGLHNKSGTVTVGSYAGSNPLYKKGHLKISQNKRYLTYGDGTPFLWLADTPWAAPTAATEGEWESYVQKRKSQHFTVLQVSAGKGFTPLTKDRDGNERFLGSGSSLRMNPAYWQGVDQKVQYATDQGIVVFMAAVGSNFHGFPSTDPVQVRRFAKNLVARLMGNFVVYSPVADEWWHSLADASGDEMAARTSMHLVTVHPEMAPATAAVTYHDKPYADFAGVQTSSGWLKQPHSKSPDQWGTTGGFSAPLASQYAIEWPLKLYNRTPVKPVLNLEIAYDDKYLQSGSGSYKQPYPTRIPRSGAYLSMLSGAKGVSYGVMGLWNWGVPISWIGQSWSRDAAIAQPSATHMGYMVDFFSTLPWWSLVPSHQLIKNQSSDWLKKMVASKTPDGKVGVAYLPDNASISLEMSAFAGAMHAKWFNPVTKAWQAVSGTVANAGTHTFTKPAGWSDAALVLSSTSLPRSAPAAQWELDDGESAQAVDASGTGDDANPLVLGDDAAAGVGDL